MSSKISSLSSLVFLEGATQGIGFRTFCGFRGFRFLGRPVSIHMASHVMFHYRLTIHTAQK